MRCFVCQYIGVMNTPADHCLNLVLDEFAYVDAVRFADGDESLMNLGVKLRPNVLSVQGHGLSENAAAKKNEAAHSGSLKGVDVRSNLGSRHDAGDGLLDGDAVFGGNDGSHVQPVPNMLLFHGLTHDLREPLGELSLAACSFNCPFDNLGDRFLSHGANGTQPALCLQQPRLLGAQQRALYIQGMTYGERLKKAMEYAGLDQPLLARRVADSLLAEKLQSRITQQTISKALRSNRSLYTSRFARACGVSSDWLESGAGEMVVKHVDSIAHWPFEFEEIRFLRLSVARKKLVERTVLAMIEGFESEADETRPPKKTKRRARAT